MDQRAYTIAIQEWLNTGSNLKALEVAEQAIESFPYIAQFYHSASKILATLGNRVRALEAAEKAVQYGHGNTEYRNHRAILLFASNNVAGALADLEITLEDQPQDITAKTLLMMCEIISFRKQAFIVE